MRFSQLAAHDRRRGSHCVQHVLFIDCLDLLPGERCAILTSDGLERDDIAFPQTRDRAVDGGRGPFADADFVRDLIGDAGARRKTHQAENALRLPVIHDFEKRRLFQLDGQSLAKRAIEDRIARVVHEIRQDDRVLVGESRGTMEVEIRRAEQHQHTRGGGKHRLPAASGGGHACQFPLQLGRGLPPAARVFFQTPAYDSFQLPRRDAPPPGPDACAGEHLVEDTAE